MWIRILSAIGMAVLLVPGAIFSDSVYFIILFVLLGLIGEFEMLRCLGLHKNAVISAPAYLLAAAGPIAARYIFHGGDAFFRYAFPAIALGALIIFAGYTFSHGKVSLEQCGAAIASTLFIAAAFTSVVLLHDMEETGRYVYLLVFIASWVTDTFAYFTGRLFGKHKLIPDVSPKKTVEGAIGGIVFCVVGFIVYVLILRAMGTITEVRYAVLVIGGIFASVISMVGDLMMSAIKRARGIKDYGRIFPGHGGVLDRFDSVMAVSVCILLLEVCTDLLK